MQPNEADESTGRSFLDRPKAPAAFVDQSHDSLGKRIALLSRPRRWIVAHDLRVSTHCRERLEV